MNATGNQDRTAGGEIEPEIRRIWERCSSARLVCADFGVGYLVGWEVGHWVLGIGYAGVETRERWEEGRH